ncbi:hypothetical protein AVEN_9636-1 [Araneus ventricosus]|uniref:Uncharacterized protein n=1 Tax=Araneus ventricosus TaxID=182803 RepID=A0A4Y2EZ17_ARAVE|nr:hypothetical protein AVEN_9636-1 [Araneus ventricosus]
MSGYRLAGRTAYWKKCDELDGRHLMSTSRSDLVLIYSHRRMVVLKPCFADDPPSMWGLMYIESALIEQVPTHWYGMEIWRIVCQFRRVFRHLSRLRLRDSSSLGKNKKEVYSKRKAIN